MASKETSIVEKEAPKRRASESVQTTAPQRRTSGTSYKVINKTGDTSSDN